MCFGNVPIFEAKDRDVDFKAVAKNGWGSEACSGQGKVHNEKIEWS